MVVQWVLKFLRESLDLKTFLLESVGKTEDFLPEVINASGLALLDSEFAFQVTDLELE